MTTFADRVISFCKEIEFEGSLIPGISIMNPFRKNPGVIPVVSRFYKKFYDDNKLRYLILGINPGRFGAGVTGIPFTDTKRLKENCGIDLPGHKTFETSSVFVYEMIEGYGGTEKFYSDFFISSVCPLGFVSEGKGGKEINYNYYDNVRLKDAVWDFAKESLKRMIEFGTHREVCFCLGTGKNYKYLTELNDELKIFDKVIPLEHPRYIMQYKSKQKQLFIDKYLLSFTRF